MNKQVEILAPAGSYESLIAAIAAGADAVYIGGTRFGARAYADNLDTEKMLQAIDYVHLHGKKIYLISDKNIINPPSVHKVSGYMQAHIYWILFAP